MNIFLKNYFVKKADKVIQENALFQNRKIKKVLDQGKKSDLTGIWRIFYRNLTVNWCKEPSKGKISGNNFFEDCKSEKLADCVRRILG